MHSSETASIAASTVIDASFFLTSAVLATHSGGSHELRAFAKPEANTSAVACSHSTGHRVMRWLTKRWDPGEHRRSAALHCVGRTDGGGVTGGGFQ